MRPLRYVPQRAGEQVKHRPDLFRLGIRFSRLAFRDRLVPQHTFEHSNEARRNRSGPEFLTY